MKNNKISVLLVSSLGDVGGIDMWTGNILSYYSTVQASDINLIHYYPKNYKCSFSGDSIIKRLFNGMYNYSNIITHVVRYLRKNKVNVLHVSSNGSLGLLKDYCLFRIGRYFKCKCVLHCHYGRIPEILHTNGFERKLLKKVLRMSDSIITMEEGSYNALLHLYPKVYNIPNPLSIEVETLTGGEDHFKRENNKIVYVGHVVPNKGLRELTEVCCSLINIKLHIIGPITDKEFANNLEDIANDKEHNWFYLRGAMSHKDVIAEMKTASILTLPSYSEGFPNVIIEGMACSCPIVATTVGAIPEMLALNSDTPCGIGVTPKSVEELKQSINNLLNDSQKALAFGVNAKKRVVSEYSVSSVWGKLVSVWKN